MDVIYLLLINKVIDNFQRGPWHTIHIGYQEVGYCFQSSQIQYGNSVTLCISQYPENIELEQLEFKSHKMF